jgi:hypothetical protein
MLLVPLAGAQAQDIPAVQELHGSLAPGQSDVLLIKDLKKGQTLYGLIETTSGNLDPILSILPGDENLAASLDSYKKAVVNLAANSTQPLLDLPALRDQYTLAWDDDSGPGYSAALQFTAPEDGDYYLLAGSSLSAAGRETSGDYRLLLGLNAPEVLTGTAKPNDAIIGVQNQSVLGSHLVQEYSGNLSEDKPNTSVKLTDIDPGDTLYVNLQATSGDLKPILLLRDYSTKPIRAANLNGQASSASLEQVLVQGGAN